MGDIEGNTITIQPTYGPPLGNPEDRSNSADILLCHNCGWNASLQQHTDYESRIKCFYACGNRGVWSIGDDYILKERGFYETCGEPYMDPDVVTTNFVRENTTIPVTAEIRTWKDSKSHFFLMKRIPGETLGEAWPRLSTEEKKNYAREVGEYIAQLRTHTAPKSQTVDGALARDTLLGSRGEVMPVIEDKEEWAERMAHRFDEDDPDHREKFKARYPVGTGQPHVLTHGDLNTVNILVHDGHISGIIDWEHAGYYPAWWDIAKANVAIEEDEWSYYVMQELGTRFGKFRKEVEFCRDFRSCGRSEYGVRNYYHLGRANFCDCKPYRLMGRWGYGETEEDYLLEEQRRLLEEQQLQESSTKAANHYRQRSVAEPYRLASPPEPISMPPP